MRDRLGGTCGGGVKRVTSGGLGMSFGIIESGGSSVRGSRGPTTRERL